MCGLGMQVKGMGQGAKTRTVRLRTVLDLKGILEVGGWRSEPVGLLEARLAWLLS